MLASNTLSICAANEGHASPWFALLKVIINHPLLSEEEQSLWWWLAYHCAHSADFSCTLSYEQLSLTLNISCKRVHRALFRFRIMGFLKSEIPIWYGKLTPEMEQEPRLLIPVNPSKMFLAQCEATQKQLAESAHHVISGKKVGSLNLLYTKMRK